jgi:hypothetical protein
MNADQHTPGECYYDKNNLHSIALAFALRATEAAALANFRKVAARTGTTLRRSPALQALVYSVLQRV